MRSRDQNGKKESGSGDTLGLISCKVGKRDGIKEVRRLISQGPLESLRKKTNPQH